MRILVEKPRSFIDITTDGVDEGVFERLKEHLRSVEVAGSLGIRTIEYPNDSPLTVRVILESGTFGDGPQNTICHEIEKWLGQQVEFATRCIRCIRIHDRQIVVIEKTPQPAL